MVFKSWKLYYQRRCNYGYVSSIIGIALSYAFYKYKEDVPSQVKIQMQERQIKSQESDNKMLNDLVDRLYKKIGTLETELKELKK